MVAGPPKFRMAESVPQVMGQSASVAGRDPERSDSLGTSRSHELAASHFQARDARAGNGNCADQNSVVMMQGSDGGMLPGKEET